MCGISGMYTRNGGSASLETVKEMGLMMPHRGPDNFGFELKDKVAMAHNRLSLLDLSDAGNQPFSNDRYMLAYNGEIYNFQTIRSRLEQEHKLAFNTTSDTEVLFFSLIHDGIDKCLAEINGMFAFAFYDKEEDTLILARDRMGIKPLYYYEKLGAFYWASEIKALARVLKLTPDPIRTLFSANNIGEKSIEHTLFKGLRSVNPGCYLKINKNNEPQTVAYYDVLDEFDRDLYRDMERQTAASILSNFEEMFSESVKSMLISDAPVGAFVSGGIDSSLISAVASKHNADIKLFTANVIGKYSEFPDVQILSKHLNKQVFDYKFEPEMLLRDWADVTYHYDCPIVVHVNSIPFSNVARLARDSGVKAVLTGEGADELFLGYPRLLTKRYESLAKFPVNAVKSLYKLSPKLHGFLFPANGSNPMSFLNKLVQGFELQQLQERGHETFGFLSPQKHYEQYLTINMIREHLVTLLHRNDRMGMMSSIEARFPFLDEQIVKFAINLPSKFKIGRSSRFHNYKHPFLIDKWIVRKTAEKYLPQELVTKKKNGFPMFGHKFVKIKANFFENGWIAENLGLKRNAQDFFTRTEDPYFIAKLASVEIFGRIFGLGQSLEEVKTHVVERAEIIHAA
ncbi:MAG TPA: asparagine synthase (glutamine-hydrolyzing) [Pyrinomonadaceae bacterium]|nr:asparagine synthase (glutamine-hydrolyzing) [Pyrinomonadaceae bacterium]